MGDLPAVPGSAGHSITRKMIKMPIPRDREPAQPAGQEQEPEPEGAVRLDLGGWISGPCLTAEELEELPADWLPQPAPARPVNGHQRPGR
jgi:hypothetical protein